MNLDRAVAIAAAGIYAIAVLLLLPPSKYAHMLGGGAAYFSAIVAVAHALGARPTHAFTILPVSFLGIAVLLMPNFPAMGGHHRAGVPLGFLGSQAGALLWITLRWEPEPASKQRIPLLDTLRMGTFGAVLLSLIASIPIALGLLSGEAGMTQILLVYPAYFIAALAAAFLYWLLQGIDHRPVGTYLIGAAAGFCLYAAVGPVVAMVEGDPIDLALIASVGVVAGCLVGPPVVFAWKE